MRLFPNKLSNVNGYELNVGVISEDRDATKFRDSDGNLVAMEGYKFSLTYALLRRMNFSLRYFEIGKGKSYLEGINGVFDQLETNKINLLSTPKKSTGTIDRKIVQMDMENDCQKMLAMMPITSAVKIYLPIDLVTDFFLIPCGIIMITYVAKVLRIIEKKWTGFHIIRIIFGMSMNARPRRITEKIIFTCIFVVSLRYSNDFYSNFLNVELADDEISYDTFESIDRSNLKVYVYEDFYHHIFWQENPHDNNLKSRAENISDLKHCLIGLINGTARHICIDAEDYLRLFQDNSEVPVQKAKIAKPVFNCLRLEYNFERASPYISRFRRLLRRFYQVGLEKNNLHKHSDNVSPENNKNENFKKRSLAPKLGVITLVGFLIAFFVFFIEVIFAFYDQKKKISEDVLDCSL